MKTAKLRTLDKLLAIRSDFAQEVTDFRDAPDFNYKWPSYQRALGALEAMDIAISEIAK